NPEKNCIVKKSKMNIRFKKHHLRCRITRNLLEITLFKVKPVIDPRKTVSREFFTAIIAVMKNVLSPVFEFWLLVITYYFNLCYLLFCYLFQKQLSSTPK